MPENVLLSAAQQKNTGTTGKNIDNSTLAYQD
jgi:hypothetical protein